VADKETGEKGRRISTLSKMKILATGVTSVALAGMMMGTSMSGNNLFFVHFFTFMS
jgi:hypothetical protein